MLPRALTQHFSAAIQRMLRPMVHHLIAQGITHGALTQMLKEIYLDVAETEFSLPFKRQTDSRLALVTGLNRKEISRLRRSRRPLQAAVDAERNLVARVTGLWVAGAPYAAADGTPHRLPYESEDPDVASFAHLVQDLSVDIPVRSVLDELLRENVVLLLPRGEVELQHEAYISTEGATANLAALGTDPAELFCTIMHNVEHPDTPQLQRKVSSDNIGAGALPAIRAAARLNGKAFVRTANALLAAHDRDQHSSAPAGRRTRVVLGAYYFEEEIGPALAESEKRPHPPGRIQKPR